MKNLSKDTTLYLTILVLTVLGLLAYNQIVYGDATCAFKSCTVIRGSDENIK